MRQFALILMLLLPATATTADAYLPNQAALRDAATTAREVQDLEAQKEMVTWAFSSFLVSLGSLAMSGAALYGLFSSLAQTRTAIKDNRELGEVQARAYVHATEVKIGQTAKPIVVCHNTGQTPAKFFAIGAELKKVPEGSVTANAHLSSYEMKAWPALAGGQTLSVNVDPTDGKNLVYKLVNDQFASKETLLLVGRIIYCDVFDQYFETGFAFYTTPDRKLKFSRPVNSLPAFHKISAAEAKALLEFKP